LVTDQVNERGAPGTIGSCNSRPTSTKPKARILYIGGPEAASIAALRWEFTIEVSCWIALLELKLPTFGDNGSSCWCLVALAGLFILGIVFPP
jgi:hypothetical protein